MSDRRAQGPDSSPDQPEYGWLYGGAQPPSDEVDPTRVMPRTPNAGAAPRPTRGGPESARQSDRGRVLAPTPGGLPPARARGGDDGSGGRTGRGSRGPRRRRPIGRIVLTVLVLWLAFLIAVPVWAWSKVDKVEAFADAGRPDKQPGTTYLLVGSDSRKGLTAAENKRLGTGGVGDVGQRTDTIMLLHTGSGPNLLLSIPRDSIVAIPGHGTGKINGAFAYGGAKLLTKTIEQNTGLHIDHYVEIGFGGFVNSVDAVGGVTICPKKRMVDRRANLRIRKGCQEVDGVTALGYARSRHTSGLGDIDRAMHQREVVSAIGAEVKSPWTFLNPIRYFRVNDAATSSLKISKGTGPIALGQFAWAMTRVNGTSGLTCSMPIRDLAVHWDKPRALQLLKLVKEDRTADITPALCQSTGMKS